MLLDAAVALRRVFEIDPEVRPMVLIVRIVRMEIAIELRDLRLARLAKRALLRRLAIIRRRNLVFFNNT